MFNAQRILATLLAGSCLSILICGCNSGNQEVGGAEPPATKANTPEAGDTHSHDAKVLTVKEATPLYDKAKKDFDAAKTDEKVKHAYIDATNAVADANLLADDLAPRVKYPAALKYYREVLKVDPKNQHALEQSQQIVDIYKQMNRPIPGEGK